ncbi:hypothetical protein [Siminovitchia sp. 179-K 8D1 HS]|uniref:hypothetical protein n=1 Tax=Siminovitchia sp. 179-K 8D1 HS TaxID=3142385 RepID=UPI00399F6567
MRDDLFEKMTMLKDEEKTMLLCRLFGLMETYESDSKTLTPSVFFEMVESKLYKSSGG